MSRSRSVSRTPSRSPVRARSRSRSARSRSRSRTHSRSLTPVRRDRSRSRSRSGDRHRHSSSRGHRSRSPLPFSRRPPRGVGPKTAATWHKREAPDPSRCLGVFNLSMYTNEKDLRELFSEFGEIEKIELVYDHPTGRSRGFGFVYFERLDDASAARDKLSGIELDGRKIRIDYSVTKRAHSPTPGNYLGVGPGPSRGGFRGGRGGGGGYRGGYDRDDYGGGYGGGSRRRSPSPRYARSSRRSRSPYERDRGYY